MSIKIGQEFNQLTVIGPAFRVRAGRSIWKCVKQFRVCQCVCGNHTTASESDLMALKLQSCGCHRIKIASRMGKANTTHGETNSPLWVVWKNMKDRCYNRNAENYADYGGRGITVCTAWRTRYESFSAWAKQNGYRPGLQIDREKNDRGYSPENCRFVTCKVNQRNRRSNVVLTIRNQSRCVAEWAEIVGRHRNIILNRLKTGWTPEAAVFTPILHDRSLRKRVTPAIKAGSLIPPTAS